MATIPYFIDCANGSLLQSDYFLIVIEFPHTCIPYVRWLCTSAKYRHLIACLERISLALFIALSSLKLVYSIQPIIGLTQEFHWVGACVGCTGVAIETIKLSG